jgi:hypothetical protein
MSLAPSFRLAGLLAAIGLVAGSLGGWKLGASTWEKRYARELAQGWEGKAKSEETARVALEDLLAESHKQAAHNAKVMNELEQKNAATLAERDRFRADLERMRAAAARSAARLDRAPTSPGQCPAPAARETEKLAECHGLLIESTAEGTRNADQLDALIQEIEPQLGAADIF